MAFSHPYYDQLATAVLASASYCVGYFLLRDAAIGISASVVALDQQIGPSCNRARLHCRYRESEPGGKAHRKRSFSTVAGERSTGGLRMCVVGCPGAGSAT